MVVRNHTLSDVALGIIPPDTVITNGTVFNAFTGEFIPGQSIWIKDSFIAYVGPDHDYPRDNLTETIDVERMVVLPGLIDAHTHILYRSGVEEFIRFLIPSGVTAFITESMELAGIVGSDGIEHFVHALNDQPLRAYYTVPPNCGLTSSEEVNAIAPKVLEDYLRRPDCVGLGEVYWGNLFAPGRQGQRVRKLVDTALRLGKRVEGHSAGARGAKLQAYTALGISSCHEATTKAELMERLHLGLWTMIREGAIRKELSAAKELFHQNLDLRRLILTTDGLDPDGFITEGYLDAAVRRALKQGAPPSKLYQMVTINVAEHFHLDHLLGSVSPGKYADLTIIPSTEDFLPQTIMCGGAVIFADGVPLVEPRRTTFPESMFHTVAIDGYQLPFPPESGKVRAMESITRLVTQETIIDLDDEAQTKDVLMILALERRGRQKAFMGFLKGFGLLRGACGSTMCWDSVDMIVVGHDLHSMETAIGRLQEIGGGAVYAIDNEAVAEFPAPLCGIVSLAPMERIRDELNKLETMLNKNGVPWEKPLLTIDTLGSAAIPHLRITHEGYVRLKDRKVLSWKV